ncbi:MAG: xylose isomerase [Acidobacteria bacterium]|nr:MAG: xylose isomerase [Acidobacteriota bacterium]
MKRRDFVRTAAAGALGLGSAARASGARAAGPAPAQDIRWGYAAITWGGNDRQAIEDVAALGFPGIQLRSNLLPEFGDKPAALKELLQAHKLTMVALSSGGVSVTAPAEDEVAKHARNAAFVRDVGGLYLQVTDQLPKGRPATAADRQALGKVMSQIGKRSADLGIPLGYHNHMNSLGERPGEVDEILAAADPRYVRFELDVAHYTQGGGDPVKAIERYHDRLLFLHLKDVESVPPAAGGDPARSYRFVELGRGRVDLPGVFAALKKARFKGWAVVELDAVPDKARTPKESGQISKSYLESHGFRIEQGGRA